MKWLHLTVFRMGVSVTVKHTSVGVGVTSAQMASSTYKSIILLAVRRVTVTSVVHGITTSRAISLAASVTARQMSEVRSCNDSIFQ